MDGSSALIGGVNQGLLSVYYYLLEKLTEAGFQYQVDSNSDPVNVKISWIDNEKQVVASNKFNNIDDEVPLPIITVEDTGGNKVPFELGNPSSSKSRAYVVTVFEENLMKRNRYVDFLENIFSEREITIYDYNSGSPATVAENQNMPVYGYGSTNAAYTTQHDDPSDPNIMDRHVGMVSFTLEILKAVT